MKGCFDGIIRSVLGQLQHPQLCDFVGRQHEATRSHSQVLTHMLWVFCAAKRQDPEAAGHEAKQHLFWRTTVAFGHLTHELATRHEAVTSQEPETLVANAMLVAEFPHRFIPTILVQATILHERRFYASLAQKPSQFNSVEVAHSDLASYASIARTLQLTPGF
eukprot:CAMPEP_0172905224 /NCGR_PEP_ID=MMETSP1075-20121228/174206_1 /TAXON_ID=2916 /ORGANISM="Ceratium fusus, Strain PA161109" /LENGTH=162 /DNA_ID=CAMNT_0013762415 /DNA_START=50 /DNA_END=538 /DNA_ORIENTATION=-